MRPPRCGTMREIDRLRERVSRLERERDEAQYAAGAWEAMALVRMTPAEYARNRWCGSRSTRGSLRETTGGVMRWNEWGDGGGFGGVWHWGRIRRVVSRRSRRT